MKPDPAQEASRIFKMLEFERKLWGRGLKYVAGIDEAGRGPLAGPVVAAAVIFPEDIFIPLIDDSKKLTPETREDLYEAILWKARAYGIGIATVEEIDELNILQASYLAMRRAIANLPVLPQYLLVDGRDFPENTIPCTPVVDGDELCFSIAAASILAKVTRDRIMCELDQKFPEYGFARHKGYATRAHLEAIERFGFSPVHRKSFHPKRFTECQTSLENDAS